MRASPAIAWYAALLLPRASASFALPAAPAPAPAGRGAPSSSSSSSLGMGGYDATVGTDPGAPIQFFTTPGNTCPYAARTYIVLEELGLPFDLTEVSGRPKPDWYLKINPRGKVPAIRIPALDDEIVYESAICCEFLCDYVGGGGSPPELLPGGAVARARMRLLNDHCDNVFTRTQFTFLMNKEEDKDEGLREEMEEALLRYERALGEGEEGEGGWGGPYLLGGSFTLADVHLLPFVQRLTVSLRHFKGYELPPDRFPRLLEWFALCSRRPSVQGAGLSEEKIVEIYTRFFEVDYGFGGLNANK